MGAVNMLNEDCHEDIIVGQPANFPTCIMQKAREVAFGGRVMKFGSSGSE